ncbi:MAG: DUF1919 domain-containing protein [Alphaproteobacteria bacterium]|nr:DUF1919 domain-containing protein [Alphaproteobacteria bacterium]
MSLRDKILRIGRGIVGRVPDRHWAPRKFRLLKLRLRRRSLRGEDICIVSNNCVGGVIAHDLGLPFNSPIVNMFIYAPDYIEFLSKFDHYLSLDPEPLAESRYGTFAYPLASLGGIELHLMHYKSFEEARAKWLARRERVKGKRLFIIGSDRDLCTPDLVRRFDRLPYPNKLFLSSKPYPDLKSVVYFPEYEGRTEIPDTIPARSWLKHIDIVGWLNRGG